MNYRKLTALLLCTLLLASCGTKKHATSPDNTAGIEAGNASKGSEVWYNLSASFDGATSSSALDMPQDDVLAQTFNSIADASFADTSLVDDKQLALQSVPGLIA